MDSSYSLGVRGQDSFVTDELGKFSERDEWGEVGKERHTDVSTYEKRTKDGMSSKGDQFGERSKNGSDKDHVDYSEEVILENREGVLLYVRPDNLEEEPEYRGLSRLLLTTKETFIE